MMNETAKKIQSFRNLPEGWHYGSGHPPTSEMMAKAIAYENFYQLLGFVKTGAFPGVDGEIMVTAYHGEHCLELTIELDGTFRFAHEVGEQDDDYWEGLSAFEVAGRLHDATIKIRRDASTNVKPAAWNSFVSSTQSTTSISSGGSSRTWPSGLNEVRTDTWEFPASNARAPQTQVGQSAPIYRGFTSTSRLTPQSSGVLMNQSLQKTAA